MSWKSVLHLGWSVKAMLLETLLKFLRKETHLGYEEAKNYLILSSMQVYMHHWNGLKGPWFWRGLLLFNFWSCQPNKHFMCVMVSPLSAAEVSQFPLYLSPLNSLERLQEVIDFSTSSRKTIRTLAGTRSPSMFTSVSCHCWRLFENCSTSSHWCSSSGSRTEERSLAPCTV